MYIQNSYFFLYKKINGAIFGNTTMLTSDFKITNCHTFFTLTNFSTSDTNMTFINVQFELTIKVHMKFHAKLRQAGAHKQIIKSCISLFYDLIYTFYTILYFSEIFWISIISIQINFIANILKRECTFWCKIKC